MILPVDIVNIIIQYIDYDTIDIYCGFSRRFEHSLNNFYSFYYFDNLRNFIKFNLPESSFY